MVEQLSSFQNDEELMVGNNSDDGSTFLGLQRPDEKNPRFGRLLVIIMFTFMVSAFSGVLASTTTVILNGLLIVVAFRTTGLRTSLPRLYALGALAIIAVVLHVVIDSHSRWQSVPAFAQFILLAVLVLALLDAVLRREVVDIQTIVGAISAYFLIGITYSWLFVGINLLDNSQFSIDNQDSNQFPDFSIVVLTTLGFGNQLPTAPLGSRLVSIEALTGQIFLAVFVARLVALYRGSRTQTSQ
jgi:hypothetical protein